jgi:site-specific recombinase XerD
MLEFWYKDRRTLLDFRRGPLGPHFDGFAAYLKEKGYSWNTATQILGKCCLFNNFLIDTNITSCKRITPSLIETFLDHHLANFRTTCLSYCPRIQTRGMLNKLFSYLIESGVIKQAKPKIKRTRYSWVLEPYIQHLRDECGFTEGTIQRARNQLCPFLEGLGEKVIRKQLKALKPETVERYMKKHMNETPENLRRLVATLRRFLRFCVRKGYVSKDLSGLVPSIPSYRLVSLPKGINESALQRMLNAIDKSTPKGTRDYAILLLMMAYGVRGKQVAELLLEDINWQRATIRIRPLKGGKEAMLPLLEAVGDSIVEYLRHRKKNEFREIFLSSKAPFNPLSSNAISNIIRQYMDRAGIKVPRSGSHTLRHSWAIRALAHDNPIKAIADVLGHRCINTTFIYAKADLKTLRQVTMPWPEGR